MERILIDDSTSVQRSVAVLRAGGVIVYPTDTAYGLGADATNAQAVEKIFAIKGRRSDNPIPVIVADIDQAKRYVSFNEAGERLARLFWPGALTLVLEASDRLLAHVIGGETTIGLRVPAHEWCRRLAAELESPLTSTSANVAGSQAEHSLEGVRVSLGKNADLVDLWVDGGTLAAGPVSTVVRAVDTPVAVKREGAISRADIERVLE